MKITPVLSVLLNNNILDKSDTILVTKKTEDFVYLSNFAYTVEAKALSASFETYDTFDVILCYIYKGVPGDSKVKIPTLLALSKRLNEGGIALILVPTKLIKSFEVRVANNSEFELNVFPSGIKNQSICIFRKRCEKEKPTQREPKQAEQPATNTFFKNLFKSADPEPTDAELRALEEEIKPKTHTDDDDRGYGPGFYH